MTTTAAADQTCLAGTAPTASISSDAADRLLTAGTVYDAFGRTTTAPAATVTGGAGLTVGYFANDLVASQSQGSTTQSWTLDGGQQRLRTATTVVNGTTTKTTVNHYDDGLSDSPDWVAETADGAAWTANVTDLLGSLAVTVDAAGAATYAYANLHGDIQATCAAGAGAPVISPNVDEYGLTPAGNVVPRYGWLGAKQRSGEDLGGLLLMGVRLYNPSTGRFLQTDPIVGGNANAYDYCTADPINCYDLDGRWGFKKWWHKHWKDVVHTAVGAAVSSLSVAAAVGLCATGVGCVVVVGAALSLSYGVAARLGTAAALHERVTTRKVVGWMGGSAFAGGRNGYSMARYGAKPGKLAARWAWSKLKRML